MKTIFKNVVATVLCLLMLAGGYVQAADSNQSHRIWYESTSDKNWPDFIISAANQKWGGAEGFQVTVLMDGLWAYVNDKEKCSRCIIWVPEKYRNKEAYTGAFRLKYGMEGDKIDAGKFKAQGQAPGYFVLNEAAIASVEGRIVSAAAVPPTVIARVDKLSSDQEAIKTLQRQIKDLQGKVGKPASLSAEDKASLAELLSRGAKFDEQTSLFLKTDKELSDGFDALEALQKSLEGKQSQIQMDLSDMTARYAGLEDRMTQFEGRASSLEERVGKLEAAGPTLTKEQIAAIVDGKIKEVGPILTKTDVEVIVDGRLESVNKSLTALGWMAENLVVSLLLLGAAGSMLFMLGHFLLNRSLKRRVTVVEEVVGNPEKETGLAGAVQGVKEGVKSLESEVRNQNGVISGLATTVHRVKFDVAKVSKEALEALKEGEQVDLEVTFLDPDDHRVLSFVLRRASQSLIRVEGALARHSSPEVLVIGHRQAASLISKAVQEERFIPEIVSIREPEKVLQKVA